MIFCLLGERLGLYDHGRSDRMEACGQEFGRLFYLYSELDGYLCSRGCLRSEVIYPNLYRSGCL